MMNVSEVDQLVDVDIIPAKDSSLSRAQVCTTDKNYKLNLSLILGTE